MINRIGGRGVVLQERFVCADDESVECEAWIEGSLLRVALRFVPAAAGDPSVVYGFDHEDEALKIEVRNWSNALGQAINEPQRIGTVAGKSLFLMLTSHRVGASNVGDLILLVDQ